MLLSSPSALALYPCEGLKDLTLHFGSEQEVLPQDCYPASAAVDPSPRAVGSPVVTYLRNLLNPEFAPTALRMALVVGSLIFAINHSNALLHGEMSRSRWVSGMLSFVTPYLVSVYGQTRCKVKLERYSTSLPIHSPKETVNHD